MDFDVVLPTVLFLVVAASVLVYRKFEKRIATLFEERKIGIRDAVLMVISMSLMVTAIVFIPSEAIQILFIAAYSYMMFSFAYVALRKWYLAVFPPVIFILLYLLYWKLVVFNLFAVIFAIIITVYMSTIFSWKTTWIFAVLLTVMDVIQVFGTGHMGEAATKMVEVLRLPVAIIVPTFPVATHGITLGLGDIFLSGVLSIQTESKRGPRAGVLTAAAIGMAMFVFEVIVFNTAFAGFFPATVVVIAGWIAGVGAARLIHARSESSWSKAG